MTTKRILVAGAMGTVGREVVAACREHGVEARRLVHPRRRSTEEPASADVVYADLLDPEALSRALEGVDGAFYPSPHIEAEAEAAHLFADRCARVGARMVFVGSHIDAPSRPLRWLLRGVMGRMIPSYRPKFRLSESVRRSAAAPVILVPTNFCQNDALQVVREGLLREQVYRYPVGPRGMNRLDVADLARAAVGLLLADEWYPGARPVVGPETLSGEACAAAWSQALGREIRYAPDPERWEAGLRAELGGTKLDDYLQTWRSFARLGIPTMASQVTATTELLGRPPTSYDRWTQRCASQWLGS